MQPRMKVALGGGGGTDDSRLLDEVFATWIGPQGKLLYLPCALRGIRPFQSCLEWMTATFATLDVTDITMWTDLNDHQVNELDSFDVACLFFNFIHVPREKRALEARFVEAYRE